MLAARVYHQSGFWGCFSTWLPVLVNAAHVGGWTWSMFSLRYLASLSMNCCAGTSCGVVKFAVSFWFFPCSKTGKPNIKAFTCVGFVFVLKLLWCVFVCTTSFLGLFIMLPSWVLFVLRSFVKTL